jgi:hypothetical protein
MGQFCMPNQPQHRNPPECLPKALEETGLMTRVLLGSAQLQKSINIKATQSKMKDLKSDTENKLPRY